ncbi:MAG: hypothetical protein ACK4N5_01985, partial [Myxococcales bacterium]
MSDTVPLTMSARERAPLVLRLMLRLVVALAAAGAMLLGYIGYFYPIDALEKKDLATAVGLCLALFGACDLAILWVYLGPVRAALMRLDAGAQLEEDARQ